MSGTFTGRGVGTVLAIVCDVPGCDATATVRPVGDPNMDTSYRFPEGWTWGFASRRPRPHHPRVLTCPAHPGSGL